MFNTIQLKRGLLANRTTITPAEGELIYTTDSKQLFVGDGSTAGGVLIAPINYSEYDNGNSGASFSVNWSNGVFQKLTLTNSCVLTFTNPIVDMLQIKLVQDGAGNRTVTFPINCLWEGGNPPILSVIPNSIDIITFYYDGTNYFGSANIGFA